MVYSNCSATHYVIFIKMILPKEAMRQLMSSLSHVLIKQRWTRWWHSKENSRRVNKSGWKKRKIKWSGDGGQHELSVLEWELKVSFKFSQQELAYQLKCASWTRMFTIACRLMSLSLASVMQAVKYWHYHPYFNSCISNLWDINQDRSRWVYNQLGRLKIGLINQG